MVLFLLEKISFSKNTYFSENSISGNISCELRTSDIDGLQALGAEEVDTVTITHDEDIIYDITSVHASLRSINEYLNGDQIVINITFDIAYNNEANEEE